MKQAILFFEKFSCSSLLLVVLVAALGCARTPQQKQARLIQRGRSYMAAGDFARAARPKDGGTSSCWHVG